MTKDKHNNQSGYIAILSILIVGAIGTVVVMSLILLGLNSSRTSFAVNQSEQAKLLADTCAEEALQVLWDNPNFIGNGNLTLAGGRCDYTVVNLGGTSREIRASGEIGSLVRKVKVIISQIKPSIKVTSWQEVPDF